MRLWRLYVPTALLLLPLVAAAELHVVIVEGLGGEERYTELFDEEVAAIAGAAAGLAEPGNIRVFRSGQFGRDDVLSHFEKLGSSIGSDDRLAVFLVGHGSYDDHEYKFNIAGPDLTDADLAAALDKTSAARILLVDTGSASGAIAERLKGERRTLLLATRSGVERHATRFGHYFAMALSDDSADLDKNRMISAEEAFRYAERQVGDYYERNGQLATEHARLEGNEGARFSLARLGAGLQAQAGDDAALQELLAKRDALNAAVEDLRLSRDSMDDGDYQAQLLQKMVDLATVEEAIEQREAELADDR